MRWTLVSPHVNVGRPYQPYLPVRLSIILVQLVFKPSDSPYHTDGGKAGMFPVVQVQFGAEYVCCLPLTGRESSLSHIKSRTWHTWAGCPLLLPPLEGNLGCCSHLLQTGSGHGLLCWSKAALEHGSAMPRIGQAWQALPQTASHPELRAWLSKSLANSGKL